MAKFAFVINIWERKYAKKCNLLTIFFLLWNLDEWKERKTASKIEFLLRKTGGR